MFRRADWLLCAAFIVLALACRLPGLATSPGWDGDEGYNVQIAWQLAHGQARMFALSYAFVQHPPLYYALLAPLLTWFGRDLLIARVLAAAAVSAGAGVLYLGCRLAAGRSVAVYATLVYAAASFIVAYTRLAYTYNLLLLWVALVFLLAVLWQVTGERRWLLSAAAVAALATLTDQEGLTLVPFVAALAWRRGRLAGAALLIGLLPAVVFAATMAAVDPAAAAQDWRQSFSRLAAGEGGAPAQALPVAVATGVARWLVNYWHLLRAEWWWPVAVAGLPMVPPLRARRTVLGLAAALAIPVFALREIEPFFRTAIPLLVPGAIGAGAALDAGMRAAFATWPLAGSDSPGPTSPTISVSHTGGQSSAGPANPATPGSNLGRCSGAGLANSAGPATRFGRGSGVGHRAGRVLLACAVLLPLGLEMGKTVGALATGFRTRIDWALVTQTADARRAALWVNQRIQPSDVVLVSPHISWQFDGQISDLFQAVAFSGQAVAFYPAGLPRQRFAYDPSLANARFVILDGFWDTWAAESSAIRDAVAESSRWPLVATFGPFRVHERS